MNVGHRKSGESGAICVMRKEEEKCGTHRPTLHVGRGATRHTQQKRKIVKMCKHVVGRAGIEGYVMSLCDKGQGPGDRRNGLFE